VPEDPQRLKDYKLTFGDDVSMSIKVKMGKRELELDGPYLTELRDSTDIFDNAEALRERFKEDGYLLIRGFHDRDKVLSARHHFLQRLADQGKLAPDTPIELGCTPCTGL
jgi:hypothetical protein